MEDRIVALPEDRRHSLESAAFEHVSGAGTILLIEDDPGVSELLVHLLNDEGHHTATAPDGVAALELVAQGIVRPDLILADYNLPLGMTGLQTADLICERLQRRIPVIVLTGDISTHTLREIARHDCLQLNKPVKLHELTNAIQTLLSPLSHAPAVPEGSHLAEISASPVAPVVFVVDDNEELRGEMRALLEGDGCMVEDYASCEAFLEAYRPGRGNCLLIDAYLPGMSGMELLAHLSDAGDELPAIMMTGSSDVPMAVRAMKAGALDFIEKPVSGSELISSVARAIEQSRDATRLSNWRVDAAKRIAELTPRQHQIMDMVLAGHPSKNIAADLGISQRTVENHRASIMKRTGSKSLPALARLAVAAVRQ